MSRHGPGSRKHGAREWRSAWASASSASSPAAAGPRKRTLGVDLGYKSGATIVWAVVAPSNYPDQGALAGHYLGGAASATVGVGLGANALLGGFDRSISLQPLSVEGNMGLDVAAGIGELTLDSYRPAVATVYRHHVHHRARRLARR